MQDASAAFETAIEKGEVTWASPKLTADWLDDGATELAAGQPAWVIDLFDNRDSQAGWGRPHPGGPAYTHLNGNAVDYPIAAAGYGQHGHPLLTTDGRATVIATQSTSMQAMIRFSTATITGTGESQLDLLVRDDGTGGNHYAARMEINPVGNNIDINLRERISGSSSTLTSINDFLIWVPGHTYVILAQITGTFFRAKYWDEDVETEPLAWSLEHELTPSVGGNYGGLRTSISATMTNTLPFYFNVHELRLIDGSIDDLSGLAGTITVVHGMDDGLPDEVSYVRGQPTAVLDAKIGHTGSAKGQGAMTAEQYLSQHNAKSPLYGLDRDVAPVILEHGVVTGSGREFLRLFTGRMQDLPIGVDRLGQMVAISDTRLKLSQLVQPPPLNRRGDLNLTWPVSWAAYECGVYAAPNPPSGCIWYAPLHGSMQPFLDSSMPALALYSGVFQVLRAGYYRDVGAAEMDLVTFGDDPESTPAYVDGPYVAAPDLEFTSTSAWGMYYDSIATDYPSDSAGNILSQAGPRGRFEFVVRGDAYNSTAPSGTDYTPTTFILGFYMQNDTAGRVFCGINMSRQLRIELSDGTVTLNANAAAGLNLPTDGEWYKYGIAWDFVTETVYFYRRGPDGTEIVGQTTDATLDVTRLPALDEPFASIQPFNTDLFPQLLQPYFHSFLPCAELYLTGGTGANPNNAPWIWEDDYEFEAGAIIKVSATRLRAIAEPSEREAWEYINTLAQAEMATVRIDEHDRLMFLTPAYWVEQEQQEAQQLLSTQTNIGSLTPQVDPTKIRNSIRVNYRDARLDSLHTPLYQSREVIAIPPGESTILIPLDVLATYVDTSGATLPTSTQVANGVSSFLSGGWHTFFTINSAADGTGTHYSGPTAPSTDPIYMQVDDVFTASAVTVAVFNRTGITLYTANTNPEVPTINIGGIGLHLVDASVSTSRASSITKRGYRGLTVDSAVHQIRADASRLSQRLLNELAEPTPTLEGVRLFGDPRRQPGDLVTVEDARGTAVSGPWRVLGIKHVINGADYTQETRLRRASTVGEWQESGTSRWGSALWGREGY